MPERCSSPICNNEIQPVGEIWRRTPRKFCSDRCKNDTWALRKTADLLCSFPAEKKIEILDSVSSRMNRYEINAGDRGETAVDNQHEINVKTYICRTWPQLSIGNKV